MAPKTPTTTRDRAGTERRLIEAASRVLARDGAAGLGINAVAAEAGADKKLIYRYFGGLDGLLEAMGADTGLWIGEALSAPGETYGARMAALLDAYAVKLRGDPVLQKLLALELAGPSETLRRIDAARSLAMQKAMPALRRGLDGPPADVDAPAINAILLAALNYLTLRGETMGGFAGLKLKTPADRARLTAALHTLIQRAYG